MLPNINVNLTKLVFTQAIIKYTMPLVPVTATLTDYKILLEISLQGYFTLYY